MIIYCFWFLWLPGSPLVRCTRLSYTSPMASWQPTCGPPITCRCRIVAENGRPVIVAATAVSGDLRTGSRTSHNFRQIVFAGFVCNTCRRERALRKTPRVPPAPACLRKVADRRTARRWCILLTGSRTVRLHFRDVFCFDFLRPGLTRRWCCRECSYACEVQWFL